jgi:hypothetical protein
MNSLESIISDYKAAKTVFLQNSGRLSDAIYPIYRQKCYEEGCEKAIDRLYDNIPDSIARVIALKVCYGAENLFPLSDEMKVYLDNQA